MDGYNGWANWETWNVNLWAMNDEALYRKVISSGPYSSQSARELAESFWPNGETPDGARLDKVDWREIVESWSE